MYFVKVLNTAVHDILWRGEHGTFLTSAVFSFLARPHHKNHTFDPLTAGGAYIRVFIFY